MADESRNSTRDAYIQATMQQLEREHERAEDETRKAQDRIRDLGKSISEETRRLREGRRRLQMLDAWLGEQEAQQTREYEALIRHPDVALVEADARQITVTTKAISIEWEGIPYRIGEFKLKLGFNGEVDLENIHNFGTSTVYDHPHITRGQPCLGNVQEGVGKLVGELQFAAAVDVIINFLQTYDPKDAWKPIENWPMDYETLGISEQDLLEAVASEEEVYRGR